MGTGTSSVKVFFLTFKYFSCVSRLFKVILCAFFGGGGGVEFIILAGYAPEINFAGNVANIKAGYPVRSDAGYPSLILKYTKPF